MPFDINKIFCTGKLSHRTKRNKKLKNASPFGQWFEVFPQYQMVSFF